MLPGKWRFIKTYIGLRNFTCPLGWRRSVCLWVHNLDLSGEILIQRFGVQRAFKMWWLVFHCHIYRSKHYRSLTCLRDYTTNVGLYPEQTDCFEIYDGDKQEANEDGIQVSRAYGQWFLDFPLVTIRPITTSKTFVEYQAMHYCRPPSIIFFRTKLREYVKSVGNRSVC